MFFSRGSTVCSCRMEFQKEIDASLKTALSSSTTSPSSTARGSSGTPIAVREAGPPAKTAPPAAVSLPHIKPYVRKRAAKGLVSGQPVAGRTAQSAQTSDHQQSVTLRPVMQEGSLLRNLSHSSLRPVMQEGRQPPS